MWRDALAYAARCANDTLPDTGDTSADGTDRVPADEAGGGDDLLG